MNSLDTTTVENIIREYLGEVVHLSLATSSHTQPWVCEVHFSFDTDLNLYFRSKASRRHSKELVENACVAGNIVKQHSLDEEVRGVYFEGTAAQVENVDEHHPAYMSYAERFGCSTEIIDEAGETDGHKFYRISVKTFYLFDSKESVPSQKYELPWS